VKSQYILGPYVHNTFPDPNPQAPSIYCISEKGAVVELIRDSFEPEALKLRLSSAVTKHRSILELKNNPSAIPANVGSPETNVASSGSQIPVSDKIERAKQLAAAKRQEKARLEAEVCLGKAVKDFHFPFYEI